MDKIQDDAGASSTNTDLYRGYEQWKGWDSGSFMQLSPINRAYFRREVGQFPLAGRKVLEIGFGNGDFLAWVREQQGEAFGTELSEQGVELATRAGVTVLSADLEDVSRDMAEQFALIAAFDVLEHLSPGQISDLLDRCATLLLPGGRFLARFPNGQSPFGRINQASDFTHVTTLSPTMLMQIAAGKPLRLIHIGEDLQVVMGSPLQRLKQRIQVGIRTTAASMLKWIFRFDAPMGVNVTVTLERTP